MLGQRVHPCSGLSWHGAFFCSFDVDGLMVGLPSSYGTRGASSAAEAAAPTLAGCLPPTRWLRAHSGRCAGLHVEGVLLSSGLVPHLRCSSASASVAPAHSREQHTLDRPVRQRLVRAIEWLRLKGNNTVHVFGSFFFCSVFYRRTMAYSSFVSLPGVTLTVSSAVGCEISEEVTPFITRFHHMDSRCAWIIPLYN